VRLDRLPDFEPQISERASSDGGPWTSHLRRALSISPLLIASLVGKKPYKEQGIWDFDFYDDFDDDLL